MSYRTRSKDWKKKVINICPCFVTELSKPEPSGAVCPNPCNLEGLKGLLLQKDAPSRTEIVKTMVRSGVFTKRDIVFALMEIHDTIFLSANRRIEEAVVSLKTEGYSVWTDDDKILKCAIKKV